MRFARSGASSRTTSSTSIAPGTSAAASSCGAAPSSGCRCRWWASSRARAAAGTRTAGSGGTPATQARTSRSSRAAPSGRACSCRARDLDPIMVQNQGALGTLGQSGEFLIYSDRELKPVPRLAESWKPNADGSQWTFKIRQGVKFQNGDADDGGGRRGDVQPARRPRQRLQRAVGVHRRAVEGRRPGHRRVDGGVRARGAERQLPVHHVLGQLQPDHPAQGLRPDDLAEDVHGHGPVEAGEVHPERGRELHEEPGLLGQDAPAAARPQRDQVLRAGGRRDPRHAGRRDRPARAVLRGQRQGAADRSRTST